METPTTSPPMMANMSENRVRTGTTTREAMTLGTTRNRVGSKPMVNRASISSETFMVPISAAKADPDLPATMMQVMIGPSSRVMERLTRDAT